MPDGVLQIGRHQWLPFSKVPICFTTTKINISKHKFNPSHVTQPPHFERTSYTSCRGKLKSICSYSLSNTLIKCMVANIRVPWCYLCGTCSSLWALTCLYRNSWLKHNTEWKKHKFWKVILIKSPPNVKMTICEDGDTNEKAWRRNWKLDILVKFLATTKIM